jgi:hypothetical protein
MAWAGAAVGVTTGGPAAGADAERLQPGRGRQAAGPGSSEGGEGVALPPFRASGYDFHPDLDMATNQKEKR